MTLAFSNRYDLYQPTVLTDTYIVTFPLFDNDDLLVVVDGSPTTAYTVNATYADGVCLDAEVVLTTAVEDVDVQIYGSRQPRRENNYLPNSQNLSRNLQRDMDALSAVMQEQLRDFDSAIVVSSDDPLLPLVSDAAARAGRTIMFSDDGFTVLLGPDIIDIQAAQGYAEVAQAAAAQVVNHIATEAELIAAAAAGGSYVLTDDISITATVAFAGTDTKHFMLDMNGYKITCNNGANSALGFTNSAKEPAVAITGIAIEDRDFSNGAAITTSVSVLTVASHSCVAGDVVKIFDDTLLPEQHVGQERQGEFAIVASVTSTEIVLRGVLEETYDTGANAKVVRPSHSRLSVKTGFFENDSVTAGASGILAYGFLRPEFSSLVMDDFKGFGIQPVGCYKPVVDGLSYNGGDLLAFSYGVNDKGCFGGIYTDLRGAGGRHLFTTGSSVSVANDGNWQIRGRTAYAKVSRSIAHGFGGAFDTHAAAIHTSFVNCVGVQSFRGSDVGGASFQIRSPSASLINCESHGSRYGLSLQRSANETKASSIKVSNFKSVGDTSVAQVLGEAGNGVIHAVFDNPMFDGFEADAFVLTEHAKIRLNDPVFKLRSNAAAFAELFDLQSDTEIVVRNAFVDIEESTETDHRLGQARGSNCSIIGDFEVFQGGADKLSNYFDGGTNDVVAHLEVTKDHQQSKAVSNQGGGSDVRLIEKRNAGASTEVSSYLQRNITVTGNQAVVFGDAGDRELFVRLYVTVTGATINAIDDGKFIGQEVVFLLRDTSTDSIIIDPPTLTGPAVTLTAFPDNLRLYWNGAQWYPI